LVPLLALVALIGGPTPPVPTFAVNIFSMAKIRPLALPSPPTTAFCRATYHFACYQPFQLQRAYDLLPLYRQGFDGTGRTIVIVDPFGSPTVRHDLGVFDRAFDLPAPPSLQIIQPAGRVPRSPDHPGWAGETELDVE